MRRREHKQTYVFPNNIRVDKGPGVNFQTFSCDCKECVKMRNPKYRRARLTAYLAKKDKYAS